MTNPINRNLFKKYDIRGLAEGERAALTDAAARSIGQAFGTYLQRFENKNVVVVGRDNRRTSYSLQHAALSGLVASGCEVHDLGLVPTPVVYWHAVNRGGVGGMMVTGSHLSAEQNGFKLSVGARSVFGEELLLLRALIENGNLAFGMGSQDVDNAAYSKYIHDVEGRLTFNRGLRVVIDAGNGVGGLFAPTILKKWGHQVVQCLYCQPDGNFPNHVPDPQMAHTLDVLAKTVRETHADVGIAFDGDADRMGAVDEQGHAIPADRLLALLARDLLTRHPGATVIADVLSSQVLFDAIKGAGGIPFMWMSGHALVKAKMVEQDALLGGEMSGHIFLREDYYGFDDAFFAAGRLLQVLAKGNLPLSALDNTLPRLYSTPEYRPRCPDDLKERVIEGVKTALRGKKGVDVSEIDGVRAQFRTGWGLLRASNTEPVLSLRFEGVDEKEAHKIRDVFADALRAFPQVEKLF